MSLKDSDFLLSPPLYLKGAWGTTVTRLTRPGCIFGSVELSLNKTSKAVGCLFDRNGDLFENAWLRDTAASREVIAQRNPGRIPAPCGRVTRNSKQDMMNSVHHGHQV